MARFVDALRPAPFACKHFKRWQVKAELWLNAMNVFWVSKGKPASTLSEKDVKEYNNANTLFVGAVLGALVDRLQDVYLNHKEAKALWDALNAEYGGTDAGTELYIIEQYHDYKMVDGQECCRTGS